jgi:hypothetical protein
VEVLRCDSVEEGSALLLCVVTAPSNWKWNHSITQTPSWSWG